MSFIISVTRDLGLREIANNAEGEYTLATKMHFILLQLSGSRKSYCKQFICGAHWPWNFWQSQQH